MKKEKVLFDTSCVYAVLMPSFEPTLANQIPKSSNKCIYFSSQYLRMEFFRRWIITGIEIYTRARSTKDINETFQYFSHRFSQRENKNVIQWANRYIKSIADDPPGEPVERFGWEVYSFALKYDETFHRIVQPKTGCKRGQLDMETECLTLREILRDFHERFTSPEHTCKLEELLDIRNGCPRLRRIRQASAKDIPSKWRAECLKGFRKLQEELEKIIESGQTPHCDKCYKIGDILIALEQPPKTTLYHVDYSFSAICPLLRTKHEQLASVLKTATGIPKAATIQ